MPGSRFTAETRAEIVASVAAGASVADAARAAGTHPSTVKGWVTRGRREPGPYAEFVADLDAAREGREPDGPMTADEFRGHLDSAVRAGSVQAMKLWADRFLRADERPEPAAGVISELAAHRRRRAG